MGNGYLTARISSQLVAYPRDNAALFILHLKGRLYHQNI